MTDTAIESRTVVDIGTAEPGLYKAAVSMSREADTAALDVGISRRLVELVKIRVSQLNGCAFCLRWHTRDALAKGETTERLAVLPAWRETAYFDEVERGALALAERVTRIGDRPVGRGSEEDVAGLTPAQVGAVTWVVIAINALNRVAITSHYGVEPPG